MDNKIDHNKDKKVLLLLPPFWTPLIPPMGLACLKGYLGHHGCRVKTVDANVEPTFRSFYDQYLEVLRAHIPGEMQGNFNNIAIDVLQNHMTAHFNKRDKPGQDDFYWELIKRLVTENFFVTPTADCIAQLDAILDQFYTALDEYLADLLQKEDPGFLGISMYKGTFGASLFAFKRTRETHPHITTVMGGGIFSDQLAMGSPNFDYFLERTPYIDKIIVGEGERLLLDLVQGRLPDSQRVFSHRDRGDRFLALDNVPLPDFSDFHLHRYPQAATYTSRSCPFQCGFCAETVNWGKYRKKSVAQVVAELRQLRGRSGCQLFLMTDSLLNPILNPLAEALAESDEVVYWDGYVRADPHGCDLEAVFKWRRAGLYRARLGIESGSPRILEKMDKRITPGQVKTVLANLALAGIKTSTYWVIGYPGETEDDFLATLDLIEEMKDHIYEAECNPFRFYPSGQVQSPEWGQHCRTRTLYPEAAREYLILQTWVLEDEQGPREEIYRRLRRFVAHCRKLGVPNPYSAPEIYQADQRWQRLHGNAVPELVKFRDTDTYLDECRRIETVVPAQGPDEDAGDFDF